MSIPLGTPVSQPALVSHDPRGDVWSIYDGPHCDTQIQTDPVTVVEQEQHVLVKEMAAEKAIMDKIAATALEITKLTNENKKREKALKKSKARICKLLSRMATKYQQEKPHEK